MFFGKRTKQRDYILCIKQSHQAEICLIESIGQKVLIVICLTILHIICVLTVPKKKG